MPRAVVQKGSLPRVGGHPGGQRHWKARSSRAALWASLPPGASVLGNQEPPFHPPPSETPCAQALQEREGPRGAAASLAAQDHFQEGG